jgi:hypothetical protein
MGSGWATVALFLATNVMERWRAAPVVAVATVTPVATGDSGGDKPAGVVSPPPPARVKPPAAVVKPGLRAELEAEAARKGVTVRTIQRHRAAAARNGAAT